MIDAPSYRLNPYPHSCSSPLRQGSQVTPEGDELECLACAWADGYYSGYDDG